MNEMKNINTERHKQTTQTQPTETSTLGNCMRKGWVKKVALEQLPPYPLPPPGSKPFFDGGPPLEIRREQAKWLRRFGPKLAAADRLTLQKLSAARLAMPKS